MHGSGTAVMVHCFTTVLVACTVVSKASLSFSIAEQCYVLHASDNLLVCHVRRTVFHVFGNPTLRSTHVDDTCTRWAIVQRTLHVVGKLLATFDHRFYDGCINELIFQLIIIVVKVQHGRFHNASDGVWLCRGHEFSNQISPMAVAAMMQH